MSQKKYNKEFKQTVVEIYRSVTPVNQGSIGYVTPDAYEKMCRAAA